jgi:tRNA dimethylallyltransferase
VSDFTTHVAGVLTDVAKADGVALLVGGTGLYLRAVARGLDLEALPDDPAVRARLEAEFESGGTGAAGCTPPGDGADPRSDDASRQPAPVVRALEIAELRGDGPRPAPRGYDGPSIWLGLDLPGDEHRRRIARRARGQFDAGLIAEAVALRERYDPSLPAFSAIGYQEAWAVADGDLTTEAAIDQDARRNSAFAKRQRTWFRAEPDVTWLTAATRSRRHSKGSDR